MKTAPSQTLQQTLTNLDRALKDAFDKKQPNKEFPVFKKRGLGDSFKYPQGFKFRDNQIFLPKIGWVSYFNSREIEGTPKNVTVSRKGKHWFVSIQTEKEVSISRHPSGKAVGIDLGVSKFATLSDGTVIEPLNSFKETEGKLAKAQKDLARKVKFSNNWNKQIRKVQNLHIKIADTRKDFLHKKSNSITNENQVVVLEDLKVSNMSKSAKGTTESPGKNVNAKSGLNASLNILAAGHAVLACGNIKPVAA
ncbi:MAG: transposase [Desulfobacterium sp.]|nr:transposase [Desulfobacterium sp.]